MNMMMIVDIDKDVCRSRLMDRNEHVPERDQHCAIHVWTFGFWQKGMP